MKTFKSILAGICALMCLIYSSSIFAQVGIGTITPNSSAMLEVNSTSKGLLIPRMTADQRSAISFPATGLIVYQTDGTAGFYYNAGTPGLPNWGNISSSLIGGSWTISGNDIYNSNPGKVGIGTTEPQSLFSIGSTSQFQVDESGDIRKINNVPYSFPSSQGSSGQVLSNNGNGNLSWVDAASSVYTVNSSNFQSVTVPADNYVRVQGTILLSSTYNNLNVNNLFISGGTFDGKNIQQINFGPNAVISGVNFNNIKIDGSPNIQFIGCKFSNITLLPFSCSLTGCQINNSIFGTTNSIGFIDNSNISGSTILRLDNISNSIISSSTMGSTTNPIQLMSNNTIDACTIYLSGNFTGNYCVETQVAAKNSSPSVTLIGNNFRTSVLSNFIDVDLNTSSRFSVNISNNNFVGNTSFPSSNYIHVFGNYGFTRSIIKISNNTAIGGTGTFVLSEYTGSADLMVNDNDLLYTGGLGLSQGGFIYVRDNQIH